MTPNPTDPRGVISPDGAITVDDLRPGDVLLYHRSSFLGQVMRLFDGTEVSHAALYLGDGVAEAVGEGVLRRSLTMSLGKAAGDYILVHRWKDGGAPEMAVDDVVAKARDYLEQGLAYGFSSVAIIALLSLTRKIPLTPKARVLLRLVLDRATSELLAAKDPSKPRLICSELVFRCYAESRAASTHTIQIAGLLATGGRGLESVGTRGGDTLLDQLGAIGLEDDRVRESVRGAGASTPPQVTDAEIEHAADEYLGEQSGSPASERALERAVATLRDDRDLLRALRGFASAVARQGGADKQVERAMQPERAFERFAGAVARFVSPGDLRNSPSLKRCGRLVMDAEEAVVESRARPTGAPSAPAEGAPAIDGPQWEPADDGALDLAIARNQRQAVGALVARLVDVVARDPSTLPPERLTGLLKILRRKRFFEQMVAIGDAAIRSRPHDVPVRAAQFYAQGLIDSGRLDAALALLAELLPDHAAGKGSKQDESETRGLIGRVYKQRYVDTVVTDERDLDRQIRTLIAGVEAYHDVYQASHDKTWHGINAVALLERARRDQIKLSFSRDAADLAREVLATIQALPEADEWAHATAAEALVALGRWDEALVALGHYVASKDVDAFECASTLRQLEQVWQLREDGPGGALILLLRATLLSKGETDARAQVGKIGGVELNVGGLRSALAGADKHESTVQKTLERSFGGQPRQLKFYREGLNRARSVARIEDPAGAGVGTGFLVRAEDFFPDQRALAGELLLMTNAHVMGRTDPGALALEQAEVRFEELGDLRRTLRVREILFESPVDALDVTIARLDASIPGAEPIPLAVSAIPAFDAGKPRPLYAIGHPRGGQLTISMEDCFQVGWEPPRYVHYRTPTEPGSSGSPVCDDHWCLIALHHASVGDKNEGIWIQAVVEAAKATAPVVSATPMMSKAALRSGVFVSYSHLDKKWLAMLQQMLAPIVKNEQIDLWDDTRISAGAAWEREIEKAIENARVAVLLVTPAFLASDFITKKELASILKASRDAGVVILWVAVSHSLYEFTPLKDLQAANDPKRPLDALKGSARTQLLGDIARKILGAADSSRVKNAFSVADQMGLAAGQMGGTTLRPADFSARASQYDGRIEVTERSGRMVTTIDAAELMNLAEPEQKLIGAYEEGMRLAYEQYLAVFPTQFASDAANRKKVERQLKALQRDVCGNLNRILDFLQSKGKHLQDHYSHVRAICAAGG